MNPAKILVAGETLVDLFPAGEGSLESIDGFRHRPGGAPANVAAGLSRLSTPPLLWTRLGGDAFGASLARTLARYGVPDRFVRRSAEDKTALALVSPTADGDRSFSFYEEGTATLDFRSGTVPDEALDDLEWVHFGGVALVRPTPRRATFDLVERARRRGCTVSFDPNTRLDLWDDPESAESVLRDAVGLTDVLLCSPADLEPLDVESERARDGPGDLAATLLDGGPDTVFLTLGGEGATVVTEATPGGDRVRRSAPAFDVEVVDTTGAGDAFAAAALARYAPGMSADEFEDLLRFANAAAALATTEWGGMGAVPGESTVREFRSRER